MFEWIFMGLSGLGLLYVTGVIVLQRMCSNPRTWIHPSHAPGGELYLPRYAVLHGVQFIRSFVYAFYVLLQLAGRALHFKWTRGSWNFASEYTQPRLLSRLFHPTKPNPVIDITTRLPTVAQIVIFIHGLHSHPFSSFKLVEELKDRFEEPWQNRILILAPPLHAKGNGPLSETVDHLWTYLKPLFEVYGPAYPVTLIGTSLGGLIALELRLRLESRRRVFVVSIAAPLIGTMGINLLQWIQSYGPKRLTIWSTLLRKHPALQQDLAFEAPLRYQLLQTLLDPAYQATTHYVFVATTNDQLILPFNASIPSLPHSTHLVTSLSNHIGVQVEMASQVIKTLMNLWISVDADKHV